MFSFIQGMVESRYILFKKKKYKLQNKETITNWCSPCVAISTNPLGAGSFSNQTLWVPKLNSIQIYTEWLYNKKTLYKTTTASICKVVEYLNSETSSHLNLKIVAVLAEIHVSHCQLTLAETVISLYCVSSNVTTVIRDPTCSFISSSEAGRKARVKISHDTLCQSGSEHKGRAGCHLHAASMHSLSI